MFERKSNPSVPSGAGTDPTVPTAERACPRCRAEIPRDGCWCPRCGLQAADPCWECGRPLAAGAEFCAYCGLPSTEPAVVECPACSTEVTRGTSYCRECGSLARRACGDCDRPLRHGWNFCPECGGEPADEPVRTPGSAGAGLQAELPETSGPQLERAYRPQDGELLNSQAVRAYESGNLHEAARLFREATQADPGKASYFTNLGVAFGELGDDLQAFNAYRRAVELNPRELSAYLNMGYLYMERERASEAREMWEKVVRLAPDSEEAEEARQNLQKIDEV